MELADALSSGHLGEVPISCPNPEHEDRRASASVNTLKGLWYCYGCGSWGDVKGVKHTPTDEALLAMLEPEKAVRVMPAGVLALYDAPGYWLDRFPRWLCQWKALGEDPLNGDPTFPVHTPAGRLAGLGRRVGGDTKYLYPAGWSAAQALWGTFGEWEHHEVLVLTEGAADATSIWELGVPGIATYGAGVHAPQFELLRRMTPKVVAVGFDNDDAGEKGYLGCLEQLEEFTVVVRVKWPRKDPAECIIEDRWMALETVVAPVYGRFQEWGQQCAETTKRARTEWEKAA